ncbi:transglutaminase domain-containing protein [Salinibacterium sp. ZJ70]|uniref:transglutaminase domain-containing protein n=1 Tax=Salinibacterium sp. ZJ70 TaxID=2708084 RepID=UPI001420E4B7|nr:transglutaminase domain-containing protein [Salinibacterium sp. ZJ70]
MRRLRSLPDGSGQLWWGLGAIVVSVALAAWAAWPVYDTSRVALVAGAGLLIGAGSVVLGAALGWRWWTMSLAAAGAYLVLVVPVAVPGALTDPSRAIRGLIDGLAGIVLGWKQLLTLTLPVGEYQAVLVPFLVTIAVGTLVATALVIAGGRAAPFAVVPMLGMTFFGAIFGASETGPAVEVGLLRIPAPGYVLLGVLALTVAIAWLLGRTRLTRARAVWAARERTSTVRQQAESRGATARRYALSAGLLVVALGAGLAAAPVATVFGSREVLRDDVDPWLVIQQHPSPLAAYRASFAGEAFERELFTVDAPAEVDRVRIATLDAFDGQTFRVGTGDENRFTRVPRAASSEAPVQITIGEGYSGVWVPIISADAPAPAFTGSRADVLADAFYSSPVLDSAVVVPDRTGVGLQSGDSFRLEAGARPDGGAFATASGGDARLDTSRYPVLDAWIELQDLPRTGASVVELVERLRSRGYLSHASRDDAAGADWIGALTSRADYTFIPVRSGHSTTRIEELFTSLLDQERRAGEGAGPEMLVAAVGDDEQFAAAAALIARHQGFDSRVVVGVRLGSTGADLAVEPCESVCTGAHLTAWAEARAGDGAWTVLDATPQFETAPTLIHEGEELPEHPTLTEQPASEVLEPPSAQNDDAAGSRSDEADDQPWTDALLPIILTVLLSAATVGLLLLPFLVFPIAKSVRRRGRRRAPDPEVAMVGAWDELIDTYVDHGIEVPRGLTRTEIADALDSPGALLLADIVDRAVFSEHPPAHESRVDSWRLLDDERREIVRATRFRTRVRAVLTPASLIQHIRAGELLSRTAGRIRRKGTS